MDELAGYIAGIVVVLAAIAAVIALFLSIGVFLFAAVAVVGAISGVFVAARNFWAVLTEAHTNVPH